MEHKVIDLDEGLNQIVDYDEGLNQIVDYDEGLNQNVVDYDEGLKIVHNGITKLKTILESESGSFSSEELTTFDKTIADMCSRELSFKYSRRLYYLCKNEFEAYIDTTVLPCLRRKHDEYLLRELVKGWRNHKTLVEWMSHYFRHVNYQSLTPLDQLGLSSFRNLAFHHFKEKAKDAIIVLIGKEREGEQIDRVLLKNALDIFLEFKMYKQDFEKDMLQDTASYYIRFSKSMPWVQEDTCSDYMLKYEECLKKERDRVSNYLHSSTEPKLVKLVQRKLLHNFATELLKKDELLKDVREEYLATLYKFYQPQPRDLESLANVFNLRITAEGTVLVKQVEDTAMKHGFIRKIIELHDKYMGYVTNCFENHILFFKALKEAFEIFCNKTVCGSSSSELLATFCDNILKKGGGDKLGDEAVEGTLEKVGQLLAFITDQDLFAEFYRKKLARRLLFDRSANADHERSILRKLKQQCGPQFTSKMERMFTDLTLAKENQTNFEEYLSNNSSENPGTVLSVTVLTRGFWPSYKSCNLNLPLEMVKAVEVFKVFYETKTKHRKLNWIYSLGHCNVNAKFEERTIELIVSTYQAATMLLFNSWDRLSFSEIETQLNLARDDLVRVLHSLSCAKYKILQKEPNTKNVSQNDYFQFNSKFTDQMRRIKIPLPPVDERKKIVEDVDKDRRYAIDAAIVRIMKSRKVLGHQQLVSECVEQLSRMFKPDIKAIKKRIEDLIRRDYLERDQQASKSYRYIAYQL